MNLMRTRAPIRVLIPSLAALAALLLPGAARSEDLAIVHVTLVSPAVGRPQPDMTVLIQGGRVTAVGPAGTLRVPATSRTFDGAGKFLIPGLWDMHSHFRDIDRDLKADVANGVLGIRDMGGAAAEVFPVRDAIAAGRRLGPRIVASGPIVDGPDSWADPRFTLKVANPEEARTVVRSLRKQGADFIKVYDGLSRESYHAIAGEAGELGMPFAGHIPNAIAVREASKAGQRSFEHGMALAGGSTVEEEYIRRRMDASVFKTVMRTREFSKVPAKIARDETLMLDHFDRRRAEETYRLLAGNRTFLTPTLVALRGLTFIEDLNRASDPREAYVSAEERRWWKPENGMLTKYRTPDYIAMRKREYALTLAEIPRARALGVRFLSGTDITIPHTFAGFSLHDELGLFVVAGLTPMQALETATVNPALCLGLSGSWGRLEPGYAANLVLLDADPLADISNTRKINSVVLKGRLLDRAQLDRLLEEARVPAAPAQAAAPQTAPARRITEYRLKPDVHRKAHLFSRIRLASRLFAVVYVPFCFWLILRIRLSARFRNWAEAVSRRRLVQALVTTPLLALTVGLLLLPLDVFDESVLKRYGVSVQSWDSWMGDWAKLQFLVILIGTLLAWILYAVIRRSPRFWWLVFWLISLPIFLLIFFLEPLVIDPMFHRFEPLSARAPRIVPELQRVSRRAGLEIPPERMFWMEASNKSVVPNAYVTGLGASKRIVVWDTTLAQETPEGLLMVFAHELGHYALGHVKQGLAFFSLTAFVLFYLGHRTLARLLVRYGPGWGVRGPDDWASLPALLLLLSLFGFAAATAGNAFSRHIENQADIYSLEITHGLLPDPGQASAESFQKFGEKVFVDPDPNPVGVFLFFDHPTVADRVRLFVTYDPWSKGEAPQFVK